MYLGEKKLHIPYHFYHDMTEWHLMDYRKKIEQIRMLHRILNDHCSDPIGIKRMIAMLERQHIFGVLKAIEEAKIALSANEETTIAYPAQHIELPLSRSAYESITAIRLNQIDGCINECLKRAGLTYQNIDTVLKVGGSSNNCFVDKYLHKHFTKVSQTNLFNSVGAGLAIAAKELFS